MALFHGNFFSTVLTVNTDITVFIPTPDADESLNNKPSGYFHDGSRFPVLYLFHGGHGDYTDWFRFSGIERYAQERRLAVVAPSVSNSFYQDMAHGYKYLTYLTEELPMYIRRLFPISTKREFTYTAGLSMGGYGALKVALQCPDNYSAAISLSGAIDSVALYERERDGKMKSPFPWRDIFADPDDIKDSDADLFALYRKQAAAGKEMPRMFISCGTEDFIYPVNRDGHKIFEDMGADLTYEEHPGAHTWDYWDTHIVRGLNWLDLPLGEVQD